MSEAKDRKEKIAKAIENSDRVPDNIKKNLTHIVLEPEDFLLIETLKLYEECKDSREKRKLLELLTEIKKSRPKPAFLRVLDESEMRGGF